MIDPFPESRPGYRPTLSLGRAPALLPPGLTEQGVRDAIAAIGARLDDPEATARDIVITAFLALPRAGAVEG